MKNKFHNNKNPIAIDDVNIDKKFISNKIYFCKKGLKYFTGYKDNEKVKPLCTMLPTMRGYTKRFNETKYMSLLIKDDELLEKYHRIWDKLGNRIKKGFDSEPAHNENYLKTKIKSMKEKSAQIFRMMEYQKKVLIAFVYQHY